MTPLPWPATTGKKKNKRGKRSEAATNRRFVGGLLGRIKDRKRLADLEGRTLVGEVNREAQIISDTDLDCSSPDSIDIERWKEEQTIRELQDENIRRARDGEPFRHAR